MAKSNGFNSSGYIPDGQTSRGTERFDSRNPKDQATRNGDGMVPDTGDSGQMQTTNTGTATSRTTNYGGNSFARGSDSSVPSPDVVNSNYAPTADQVPTPKNVSAYRSYDVPPVELPSPNGDMRETPGVPRSKPGTGDQS